MHSSRCVGGLVYGVYPTVAYDGRCLAGCRVKEAGRNLDLVTKTKVICTPRPRHPRGSSLYLSHSSLSRASLFLSINHTLSPCRLGQLLSAPRALRHTLSVAGLPLVRILTVPSNPAPSALTSQRRGAHTRQPRSSRLRAWASWPRAASRRASLPPSCTTTSTLGRALRTRTARPSPRCPTRRATRGSRSTRSRWTTPRCVRATARSACCGTCMARLPGTRKRRTKTAKHTATSAWAFCSALACCSVCLPRRRGAR